MIIIIAIIDLIKRSVCLVKAQLNKLFELSPANHYSVWLRSNTIRLTPTTFAKLIILIFMFNPKKENR
jgi:hypothetical protein